MILPSSTVLVICTIFFSLLSSTALPIYSSSSFSNQIEESSSSGCIMYDSEERIITVNCKSANLTDIDNQLKDPDILHRETSNNDDAVWLLNAGIVVAEDATLYISPIDTSWLKIVSDGEIAYGIHVLGGLKIDSVKITSWNLETNSYTITSEDGTIPRPFIRAEPGATDTIDITNSEIAYLGYGVQVKEDNNERRSGIVYYGGDNSMIKGNRIHHNMFGFYSNGVGSLILEDNHVYNNYVYGFDPHTGTHDMIIRNNTVYDTLHMGIICSLDCYNIIIEDNEVYNNTDAGIMFSRNMYDSIARNNYVHDEKRCIFVSLSHDNEIYNNRVSNCKNGIHLSHDSSDNNIYNNTITNSKTGLGIEEVGSGNKIYSNTIIDTTEKPVNIEDSDLEEESILKDNKIINAGLQH
jgi:mannuronan 5-epimerase